MPSFTVFVESLVAVGVVVAAVRSYLIINKIWTRKEVKEVAESVSVSAALLGIATSVPIFVQLAVIEQTPLPAAKTAISILTAFVFLFIGTGIWVRELRGTGFKRLLMRALSLEREEVGDLVKELVQPKGAEHILRILEEMATIDRRIDASEIDLIHRFARHWKIPAPKLEAGTLDGDGNLLEVRRSVVDYLEIEPPKQQAAELLDVLNLFVKADAEVSPEERTVMEEIEGMIEQYVDEHGLERETFEVVIVPQSDAQFEAVRSLLPDTRMKAIRGGKVFSVGHFFSEEYADAVCQKYINLGLFTAYVTP